MQLSNSRIADSKHEDKCTSNRVKVQCTQDPVLSTKIYLKTNPLGIIPTVMLSTTAPVAAL
jgi:hypothetical protein